MVRYMIHLPPGNDSFLIMIKEEMPLVNVICSMKIGVEENELFILIDSSIESILLIGSRVSQIEGATASEDSVGVFLTK